MKKQIWKLKRSYPVIQGDATINLNGYHARVLSGDSIDLTLEVSIIYSRWRGIKHVFLTPVHGIDSVEEIEATPPDPDPSLIREVKIQ
jgi:hypothetical protein